MNETKELQAESAQERSELLQIRRDKLAALRAEGRDPFLQTRYDRTSDSRTILENFDALENQDVSVAIDNSERLCKILAELEQYAKILMEDRMSIVSVVGNMRWQYAGVEAQIIEALADIPLRMISYGSNDSDVAFVIKTEDKKRALQALSNRLFEPETDKIVK